MGLRLTFGSFEGMKELSKTEQKEIFQKHWLKAFQHGQTWIGILVLFAGSFIGQAPGLLLGNETLQMILGSIGFIAGLIILVHLAMGAIEPYIKEEIASRKNCLNNTGKE